MSPHFYTWVCYASIYNTYIYLFSNADGHNISFFVIGDWGSSTKSQAEVSHAMQLVAASSGCDFIISTGDNFYPDGIVIPRHIKRVKHRKEYIRNYLEVSGIKLIKSKNP